MIIAPGNITQLTDQTRAYSHRPYPEEDTQGGLGRFPQSLPSRSEKCLFASSNKFLRFSLSFRFVRQFLQGTPSVLRRYSQRLWRVPLLIWRVPAVCLGSASNAFQVVSAHCDFPIFGDAHCDFPMYPRHVSGGDCKGPLGHPLWSSRRISRGSTIESRNKFPGGEEGGFPGISGGEGSRNLFFLEKPYRFHVPGEW